MDDVQTKMWKEILQKNKQTNKKKEFVEAGQNLKARILS